MSNDIAIKVSNVSKTFILPHEKQNSIKSLFVNFYKRKKGYEKQQALKDISFEVKKGEFFGIVGRNGSGKSTLLKLISQIYTPDSGSITVNGKLTPFIELGVGFNPELSGRENVFLNGALLGFSRKEMEAMYDEIVEFAELERFMDQKLKNYSSGMQVRLAFSIAIRANTDVLVLDEVLAVGDAAFQQKCNDYFDSLKRDGKTVILVTHDMKSVVRFCDRALLIEDSLVKAIGDPEDVSKQYTLDNLSVEKRSKSNIAGKSSSRLDASVKSLGIELLSKQMLSSKETLEFKAFYELNEELDVDLGIAIVNEGKSIVEHNTQKLKLSSSPGQKHSLKYSFPVEYLNAGRYEVNVSIFRKKGFIFAGINMGSCTFIVDRKQSGGVLAKRGEWKVVD